MRLLKRQLTLSIVIRKILFMPPSPHSEEVAAKIPPLLSATVLPEGKRMKVSVARPAWKANIHSNLYVSGIPLSYTEKDVK